jgi:hypothetical protein
MLPRSLEAHPPESPLVCGLMMVLYVTKPKHAIARATLDCASKSGSQSSEMKDDLSERTIADFRAQWTTFVDNDGWAQWGSAATAGAGMSET